MLLLYFNDVVLYLRKNRFKSIFRLFIQNIFQDTASISLVFG